MTDGTFLASRSTPGAFIRRIRLDRRWRGGSTFSVDARWNPRPVGATPGGRLRGDLLVTAVGELDMATELALVRAVARAVDRHHPERIRLDLAGLRFIDARGIAALISCRQVAVDTGAVFVISPVAEPVQNILCLTGLQYLLPDPCPG